MKIRSNDQINFQAKISSQFENFMRSYINHGEKRIQNNYKLNKKIADLDNYGYDEYTINLVSKYISWGNEYSLVATKDGQNIKNGIFITKRNSVKQVINYFLKMNKRQFTNQMKKNHIYHE